MQHSRLFLLVLIAFSGWFTGCAPSVRTTFENRTAKQAKPASNSVLVLEQGKPRPTGAEVLGFVRILDNGFSFNCSFPEVVELAKQATQKAGGNALQVLEHQKPDIWSTCHRIEAVMLFVPATIKQVAIDSAIIQTRLEFEKLTLLNPDTLVEIAPQFPGGEMAVFNYLNTNVLFPRKILKQAITGIAVATFIVDERGKVSEVTIQKSLSPAIDMELISVLSSMPPWIPGFQKGKPVKKSVTLPINFGFNKQKVKEDK